MENQREKRKIEWTPELCSGLERLGFLEVLLRRFTGRYDRGHESPNRAMPLIIPLIVGIAAREPSGRLLVTLVNLATRFGSLLLPMLFVGMGVVKNFLHSPIQPFLEPEFSVL